MDTGGKIATGVAVPLAVGAAAVAAYFLYKRHRLRVKRHRTSSLPKLPESPDNSDDDLPPPPKDGGKRRTQRRHR
jgi:hypothetical protein